MRPLLLALMAAVPAIATPAAADEVVDRTLADIVLPAFRGFAEATAALAEVASGDCRAANPALRAAFQTAFDAWIPVSYFHAGPMEEDGRNLAIAFWPDPIGSTPKALRQLLARDGRLLADGASYARASVAARGLAGLQAMLYDPDFNGYGPDDVGCRLVRAAAAELAANGAALDAEWQGFAQLLRSAGPGNPRFLSVSEARQYLYTSLLGGMQFDDEQRLTRPLGTVERPRPERAEARASGRSLRNVQLSLAAATKLAQSLSPAGAPQTFAALAEARQLAETLDDPIFDAVATPAGRARLLALRTAIHHAGEYAKGEIGSELGVSAGFNSLDGD